MNEATRSLRVLLKERRTNMADLAKFAGVGYNHLMQVLGGRRKGARTWERLRRVLNAKEQRLIVDLYGPVFGEDWVDDTAREGALV